MKRRKRGDHSDWKTSKMAFFVFIGGSIGGQLVHYPDIPYLPSILGSLTGSLLLVAGNVGYVIYIRKVSGSGNQKQDQKKHL